MQKRGRKPISAELKKIPLTIYVRPSDIKLMGGKSKTKEEIITFLSYKTQAHETRTYRQL